MLQPINAMGINGSLQNLILWCCSNLPKIIDERLQKLTYQNLRQIRPDIGANFDKNDRKKIAEY